VWQAVQNKVVVKGMAVMLSVDAICQRCNKLEMASSEMASLEWPTSACARTSQRR
jgi:hypothetical protein